MHNSLSDQSLRFISSCNKIKLRKITVSERGGLKRILITRFFFLFSTEQWAAWDSQREDWDTLCVILWLKTPQKLLLHKTMPGCISPLAFNPASSQKEWPFDIKIRITTKRSIANPADESHQQELGHFWQFFLYYISIESSKRIVSIRGRRFWFPAFRPPFTQLLQPCSKCYSVI